MGVMADSVHQVVDFTADQIQAAPAFGPRVHIDCLFGMASSNSKFVLLLDIDRIFSSHEIVAAGSTIVAEDVIENLAVVAE
ncbi:MAG: purine-binding chemotaxis protein CheW [Thermoanaerobaculia bacterium]|jgi:purine-binding chemotaxis protein CheW|nr:purine-binding chemotaxis protein CheW [Thermoanaerobaculia bacterium]